MISCPRCNRPAPVDLDELTGDGGGDPALLPVVVPPDGWIGDPDSDGLVCGDCATPDEIARWMDDCSIMERSMDDAT
jgi:hypothetical protein